MPKFKGITSDSREVRPGFIFVAIKGRTVDGHDFVDEAIKKGAAIVYGERNIKNPKYVKVPDSRQKLGELASEFYGNPSSKLKVIGVTGTKGKTTTCHMIYHILTKLGRKAGLISSITTPGLHVTTPETVDLHKALRRMVDEGCEYAVIEVSSHGIDQKRVAGVKFDIGVLTNVAPEHLDYHKTFSEYKKTKMSFVNSAREKVISPSITGLKILPGKFNNLNAETALQTVQILGIERQKAVKALYSFKLPEGRLERIDMSQPFAVYIDFAHTPDSLKEVSAYLRGQTKGRLISVFGCAGERDPRKRSKMGKISTQIADLSVFTAEDPRSEDILNILSVMRRNAKGGKFVSIPERGEGVAYALWQAKMGDTVAILGKGHEKSMAYQGFEHSWSDRGIVESILNADQNVSAVVLAAGKGVRMKSPRPKVLREICGRPMIAYTLENLRKAGLKDIVVVVGFRKNEVIRRIGGAVKFAIQKNPKGGTADSAKVGLGLVSKSSKTLVVINGDDSAFYRPETIKKVIDNHNKTKVALSFVSLIKENPFGLGRIIRDQRGNLLGIVEEKDATDEQRKIKEINDGLYVFDRIWFEKNIGKVKKGPQGEYYLVDLVKIGIDSGDKIAAYRLPDDSEWHGINTPEELIGAQKKMEERLTGHGA